MDFSFSPEQDDLRGTLRDLLTRRCTSADIRRIVASDTGHDAELWTLLCDQVGVAGLAVAEDYGGAGASWVELAVALEEAGRALLPGPLLSTTVAAAAIERAGDQAAALELLPRIASGASIATLAVTEGDPRQGRAAHVVDGDLADLFVVVADTGLYVVDAAAAGVSRTTVPTLDQTRRQSLVEFRDAPSRQLGGPDAAATALDLCAVALAVESVGAARRCLELTVAHLQTREQFGRPIGSFQALKHRVADLVVELEAATSTAYYAAWAAAAAPDELPVVAPLAKGYCTSVFVHVAAETIQLHGGIGFTWEHDAHLYFKRAKTSQLLFGDAAAQRRLVADRAGLTRGVSASAPGDR